MIVFTLNILSIVHIQISIQTKIQQLSKLRKTILPVSHELGL